MLSLRRLLAGTLLRPHLALALAIVSTHFSVVAVAAPTPGHSSIDGACSHVFEGGQPRCTSAEQDSLQLSLPKGEQSCPNSGVGAACDRTEALTPDTGVASTPPGDMACDAGADQTVHATPAACADTLLPAVDSGGGKVTSAAGPVAAPSVPVESLRATATNRRLELAVDATTAAPDRNVVLTATADAPVSGGNAIEIFDLSTSTLVGACAKGGQCAVAYRAHAGLHNFAAFVTPPTSAVPTASSVLSSNHVDASWIGVTLQSNNAIIGPGQPVTITATSTIALDNTGWLLQMFDAPSHQRLTFCASGNACTVAFSQPVGGSRSIVAVISRSTMVAPPTDLVVATSDVFTMSWLSVAVRAWTSSPQAGGVVHVTATANADLSGSPWSIGIFDDRGQLVAPVCSSGAGCSAEVTITDHVPSFSAAVGLATYGRQGTFSKLANIQARSELVKPAVRQNHLLWGVDSCKTFTDDPAGSTGLYPRIAGTLGTPDFWGRYLTDAVCAPLSATEVAAAQAKHMGILPIYNERDCSNVAGYDTGKQYAAEAVAAATALGVPEGTTLAIDIEPPGPACPGAANVDAGLVSGWYDGITGANYVPTYYENGTPGSEFANAWCSATSARPEIASASYLWAFHPSLLGNFNRATAPTFGPYDTGCGGNLTAWQYQIDIYSRTPDVDQDEALSAMPLWFP